MNNRLFVTDTHPLIHFFFDSGRKLSQKVRRIFDESIVSHSAAIFVPSAVLWEISILAQNGSVQIPGAYEDWIDGLFEHEMINPVSFDHETAKRVYYLNFNADPFDKAIVATALQLDLPLITNDSKMHENKPCPLIWS